MSENCVNCGLEYYDACECIECPCCQEQTKLEDMQNGKCKWCEHKEQPLCGDHIVTIGECGCKL